MEGYGVSQQTDEGYSEDPLNNASDPSAFAPPYKSTDVESASSNPLSNSSPAQLKGWMSTHIASLPTELRARAYLSSLSAPFASAVNLPAVSNAFAHLARLHRPWFRPKERVYFHPSTCADLLELFAILNSSLTSMLRV